MHAQTGRTAGNGALMRTAIVGLTRPGDRVATAAAARAVAELTHATAPGVAAADHLEVWLVDSNNRDDNPHLDFVLADTADAVAALRAERKRVLLHCVAAQQRTPSVALAYAVRHLGREPGSAAYDLRETVPGARGSGLL